MPTLVPSILSKYELSEHEEKEGSILTSLQKMVLQNIRADFAEEKIRLKFNSADPFNFAQQEAELQGKIGVIDYLLEISAIASAPQSTHNQEN